MAPGGFFNNIETDLGSAVVWIASNSDSIQDAARAIAKAGGGAHEDEDAVDIKRHDATENIQRYFIDATRYIEAQAGRAIQRDLSELRAEPLDRMTTIKATLTGLCTFPMAVPTVNVSSTGITQDVSKFLAGHCLPTYFRQGDDKFTDVAAELTQSAFPQPGGPPLQLDGKGVAIIPFRIENPNHGFELTGAHAFYHVPLGENIAKTASHSCISINVTIHERNSFAMQTSDLYALRNRQVGALGGWLISFRLDWISVLDTIQVWPLASEILLQSNASCHITYNTTMGNIQIVKIESTPDFPPAQIKKELTSAISKALTDTQDPLPTEGSLPEPPQNPSDPRMPTIAITNATMIPPTPPIQDLTQALKID